MSENNISYKKHKLRLAGVIIYFYRWFKISCPKCKFGKLNQDDIHHCLGGGELNVYTCDKCNSKFV